MMWDGWGPAGWAGWFFMIVAMIAFWALVIGLVVWVVRQFRPGPGQGQRSTALSILEERLARGEIDEEELRRRKQTLLGG